MAARKRADNSFIVGRDQDNNGVRDVNLTELVRRFDHLGNSAVTESDRWAIPNILRVEKKDYPTLDQAVMTTAMTETRRILDSQFTTSWQADKTIMPLLMYASEASYRSLTLEGARLTGGYVSMSANAISFNFQPSGSSAAEIFIKAGVKWMPYCGGSGATPAWDSCSTDAYWKELIQRHPDALALPGDPDDADVRSANTLLMEVYGLNLREGTEALVQSGTRILLPKTTPKSDAAIVTQTKGALKEATKAVRIISRDAFLDYYGASNINTIRKYIGNKWTEFSQSKPGDILKNINLSAFNRAQGSALIAGGILLIGGLVTAGIAAYLPNLFPDPKAAKLGGEIALRSFWIGVATYFGLVKGVQGALDKVAKVGSVSKALLSEASATGKAVGVVGAVIAVGLTWGFFIYSMVSNHVTAFSPDFNKALAAAIAATIFTIISTVIAATVIGGIILAIIGVIDAILEAACAIDEDVNSKTVLKLQGKFYGGSCFTISTSVTKVIAYLLYNYDLMVDSARDDLVVPLGPKTQLANPQRGFVASNPFSHSLTVSNTVVHKDPDPANGLYIYPYLWLFSADSLRSSTVRQTLSSAISQTLTVDHDQMNNEWAPPVEDHKFVLTPMYRTSVGQTTPPLANITLSPGLNRPAEFYLNLGYAFPAYECIGIPNILPPWFPPVIPICYPRTFQGSNSTKMSSYKFDIFPDTLDSFMELTSKGNGDFGLKWDAQFGSIKDADGDGLLSSAFGGLDPNDASPDSDNDGLSDTYELQRRQSGVAYSPVQCDTDNDGLTDLQESQLDTDPALADSDNDGLKDGEEVWHEVYDANCKPTGVWTGGWDVTIGGTTPITVHVSSNPTSADSDNDGVSDLAEFQLRGQSDGPGGLPYNPLVPNKPPFAIYTQINNNNRFVSPGQCVIYTTTVIASQPLAPSVLDVVAPSQLGGSPAPFALAFNAATFTDTQTVIQQTILNVQPIAGTTFNLPISSTVRARLAPTGNLGSWTFDLPVTATLGTAPSLAYQRGVVAANRVDRTDNYLLAGLARTPTGGDVNAFTIPAGTSRAVENDNNDTTASIGANTSVASNNRGDSLVVWDQRERCNTLTINWLQVIVAADDPGGGIEPFFTNSSNSNGDRLWDWTVGGGTPDMKPGQQRGPNAFGFPISVPFCDSTSLYMWESDGTGNEPVGSKVFNYNDIAQDANDRKSLIIFSGSGHTIALNVTLPVKDRYTVAGALVGSDGTLKKNIAFPRPSSITTANQLYSLRPVVASNGDGFLIAYEAGVRPIPNSGLPRDTYIAIQIVDGNGNLGASTVHSSVNFELPFTLTDPPPFAGNLRIGLAWMGDRYRLAVKSAPDTVIRTNDYSSTGIPTASSLVNWPTLVRDVFATGNGNTDDGFGVDASPSLAYDPNTGRWIMSYIRQTDGAGIVNQYPSVASNIPMTTRAMGLQRRQTSAVYDPLERGWLVGWVNLSNGMTVFPLKQSELSDLTVGPQVTLTGNDLADADLACPIPTSQPVADLRFEELPGATTFADSSGLGNNAGCSGASCPAPGLPGAVDKNNIAIGTPPSDYALRFDGVDDSLTLSRTVQNDFTIAVWIKLTTSNVQQMLVDGGFSLGNGFEIRLNSGSLAVNVPGFNSQQVARIDDGQWHFVAVNRTKATGRVEAYVDGAGVIGVSGTSGVTLDGAPDLRIGRSRFGSNPFTGMLDGIQIYRTALAGDAVKALYDRTQQTYCAATRPTPAGNHSLQWAKLKVYQPDLRGGKLVASSGLTVTIDADKPSVTIAPVAGEYVKGSKGTPTTIIIGGNANDETSGVASVAVSVNGGAYQPANGAAAWTFPLQVTEGLYQFNASVTDVAGNVAFSTSSGRVFADGGGPTRTLNTASTGRITPTRNQAGQWHTVLSGQVSDPAADAFAGSGVGPQSVQVLLVALDSTADAGTNVWQTATVSGNTWTVDYVLPNAIGDNGPIGIYKVSVQAKDKVGNSTLQKFVPSVIFDASGPLAQLTQTDVARGTFSNTITTTVSIGGVITETGVGGLSKLDVAFVPITQVLPLSTMVVALTFDEAAGNLYFADSSGQFNGATCTGTSCPTTGVAGRIDRAAQFDGVDDILTVNRTVQDDFTVAAWVKTPAFTRDAAILVDQGAGFLGGFSFFLNDGRPDLIVNTSEEVIGAARVDDNQWHHLAATRQRSSGQVMVYVDGNPVANRAASTAALSFFKTMGIGGSRVNPSYFTGLLDQVQIFTRALTPAEVQAIYQSANRASLPATLTPSGITAQGYEVSTWTLPVPAGLDGLYQIDLRGVDTRNNRRLNNVWRGIIDTLAPRVSITGTATGASFLDTASNTPRYEIAYSCRADDFLLDEAAFDCAGNNVQPPTRTLNDDPILQKLFPDLTLLTTLTNSYTLWEPTQTPSATVRACDAYDHCASAQVSSAQVSSVKLGHVAPDTLTPDTSPKAVIVEPTEREILDPAAALEVTIEAEAAQSLKEVSLLLDGTVVKTLSFPQADAATHNLQAVALKAPADGLHRLEARACDWSGATQTTLFPRRFTVDSQPPSVSIDSASATLGDTYGLGSGIVRLRGQASDTVGLDQVQVRVGDGHFAEAIFANGEWRIAYPVADPEGKTLQVSVRAIDLAGHVVEANKNVGVDLSEANPPDTSLTGHPSDTSNENTATFTFSGTLGDHPIAEFTCALDDGVFTPCVSPISYNDLSKGRHTFRVRAVDSLGFVDPSPASFSWTVNAVQPDVTITAKPSDPSTSRAARFAFSGGAGAVSFECALDGNGFTPCTSPQSYSGLRDGVHTFQVRATDSAGKRGAAERFSWRVVNAPPVASSQLVTTTDDVALPITLNASDDDALRYQVVSRPVSGTLLGVPPRLSYVPDFNFFGVDSFTFRSNDGEMDSNVATVSIVVQRHLKHFVVLGQESIALQQQSSVTNGDVGARVASAGPFLADGGRGQPRREGLNA